MKVRGEQGRGSACEGEWGAGTTPRVSAALVGGKERGKDRQAGKDNEAQREAAISEEGQPGGGGGRGVLRKGEAATVGLQGRGSAQRGGVFQQFKVCSHGISFQDEEGQ